MDERASLGLKLETKDTDEFNLGTPILRTRYLDGHEIANGYTQILLLTQMLGGVQVGGIGIAPSELEALAAESRARQRNVV